MHYQGVVMGMIGRIQRVNLREVWKSESRDFTPWLEENIDVLSDALEELTLVSAEREKSAGTFSVDLIAEDEGGSPVIIEKCCPPGSGVDLCA